MIQSFVRSVLPAFAAAIAVCAGAGAQTQFIPLGKLPGGQYGEYPYSISADGRTIAGFAVGADGYYAAFRWTDMDGMVPLGQVADHAGACLGYGVSATGRYVVGTAGVSAGSTGFIWTAADGIEAIGDLPGDPLSAYLYTVSEDGSTAFGVGDWTTATAQAAVWRRASGWQGLGWLKPGDVYSEAISATPDGLTAVGRSGSSMKGRAFIWTPGSGMIGLAGAPDADYVDPWAISADGKVISGGYGNGDLISFEGFVWSDAGGFVGIGDLPGGPDQCFAWALNGDGSVIVGQANTDQHDGTIGDAFYWTAARGMRALADVLHDDFGLTVPVGWHLISAEGISGDGTSITGFGKNPDGNYEGFLIRLGDARVCEPDCNHDGKLNINDFICFQSEWRKKSAYGDYNGDGKWNINDFIAYQAGFRQGCP